MTSTQSRRRLLGLLLILALLIGGALASILVGGRQMPIGDVWNVFASGCRAIWRALTHVESPQIDKSTEMAGIVWDLRFPRTLLGLFVGLAIGAAGAITQGHTRNPIADPGILGVNAGAACAVVIGVYLFGIGSPTSYMAFGLLGAVIASAVVFGVSTLTGAGPVTLVLAGTGLSAMLIAITSAVVLSDSDSLDAWRFWSVGSLAGRGLDIFWAALPFIVIGLVLAVASGFFLNVLALGDDVAKALGSRVLLIRAVGVVGITLLVGAATAACGPIVFLGLVVPHIARAFTGPDYRWIVPYSALIGATLLLWCDVIGRVIARPDEIQVGVVLAFVGAPFLIAMVRRTKLMSV